MIKQCLICGKDFYCRPVHKKRAKFCSRNCTYKSQRIKTLPTELQKKLIEAGYKPPGGWHHTLETRKKYSASQRGKFGDKARGWQGGRRKDVRGYIMIATSELRTCPNGAQKRKYISEHRLVMEKHLGRKLFNTESIHHRNGIKDDNRVENLEIVFKKIHDGKVICPYCLKEFSIK